MPLQRKKLRTPKVPPAPGVALPHPWTSEQKQQIAELAYHYFVSRGGQHGSPLDDWLRAETALAATLGSPASKRRKGAKAAPAGA